MHGYVIITMHGHMNVKVVCVLVLYSTYNCCQTSTVQPYDQTC